MVIWGALASSQCDTRSQQGAERGTGESRCAITTPTPPHMPTAETSRFFSTETVDGGLPIHIAAKFLGHLDLNPAQAYVAVYSDEVIRHYRQFVDQRRTNRPGEEYRESSDTEWQEFRDHFSLRKVALGACDRPYGTPCRHENACVRCPMLRLDLAQEPRLLEIETNPASASGRPTGCSGSARSSACRRACGACGTSPTRNSWPNACEPKSAEARTASLPWADRDARTLSSGAALIVVRLSRQGGPGALVGHNYQAYGHVP
ncbi:hypothetical protein [Streptomyces sp. NPDC050263]|uniref:hypothetical protein n=1 Tax=Streptomyces sp. NPDC050263 TaxID=3155037 RepID=UPI0034239226